MTCYRGWDHQLGRLMFGVGATPMLASLVLMCSVSACVWYAMQLQILIPAAPRVHSACSGRCFLPTTAPTKAYAHEGLCNSIEHFVYVTTYSWNCWLLPAEGCRHLFPCAQPRTLQLPVFAYAIQPLCIGWNGCMRPIWPALPLSSPALDAQSCPLLLQCKP